MDSLSDQITYKHLKTNFGNLRLHQNKKLPSKLLRSIVYNRIMALMLDKYHQKLNQKPRDSYLKSQFWEKTAIIEVDMFHSGNVRRICREFRKRGFRLWRGSRKYWVRRIEGDLHEYRYIPVIIIGHGDVTEQFLKNEKNQYKKHTNR